VDKGYKTVDGYIKSFPPDVRNSLEKLRQAIRESAPQAVEVISYHIPAYKQNGILVYFAAHKNHIGFYPTASGIEAFKTELEPYKLSKGTVRFLLDKPVPFDLVKRIVAFRVKEQLKKKTG